MFRSSSDLVPASELSSDLSDIAGKEWSILSYFAFHLYIHQQCLQQRLEDIIDANVISTLSKLCMLNYINRITLITVILTRN